MSDLSEKKENIVKIKNLLETNEPTNILLACQLIESLQLSVSTFLSHLYLLWEIHFYAENKVVPTVKPLLEKCPDSMFAQHLRHREAQGDDYDQIFLEEADEAALDDFFTNVLMPIQALDVATIANLLLKWQGQGGAYCLKHQTASNEYIIRYLIEEDGYLWLEGFGLDELPEEVGWFPQITKLDLKKNHFKEIPQSLKKLENLERIYIGDTPLSQDAYHKLENFFPVAMAKHYSDLARDASRNEAYTDALLYSQKATLLHDEKVSYWINQGVYLEKLDQAAQALTCYNKAISLDRSSAVAYSNKIGRLVGLQRYQEALTTIEIGLDLYSKHPSLDLKWKKIMYYHKGLTLYYLKKYEEAQKAYDESLHIDNMYASALFNKACVFALQHNKSEMLVYLQKAIDQNDQFRQDAPQDKDLEAYWQDSDFLAVIKNGE
ncbi:hypothetical protein BKI52_05370 [marine bacterium AO1-C]|nr:hypothetical protein BKI52_05370 [marine bacterium AO1-C]